MKQTSIVGWYGRGNCGDEAFKDAFDILLPGTKEFSTRQGPGTCILGGGDVIKEYYLNAIEGDFFIVGCGLGYPSEAELLKGRRIRKAFFRNHSDVFLASAQGVNAHYIPDLVFALERPEVVRTAGGKKKAVVILNDAINPTYAKRHKASEMAYTEYFKWEMAEALSYLTEWYDFTFVPFSEDNYNRDTKIHYDVISRMPRPSGIRVINNPRSPKATIELIAEADLVISMKFHGLVFSIIAGVPFVNVGLSRKTDLLCSDNGLSKLSLEPFSFTKDRFLDAVTHAERLDPEILKSLAAVKRMEVNATFAKFRTEFGL